MSASGLSKARLGRMRQVLSGHVARGELPGLVALVARRGEVHVEAIGTTEVGGSGGPRRRRPALPIPPAPKPHAAPAGTPLAQPRPLPPGSPSHNPLPHPP